MRSKEHCKIEVPEGEEKEKGKKVYLKK